MEQPSYYAIIPSNVRYDSGLTANAKLLYGEITALCSAEGFCWATNRYFAELYDVSTGTVSGWIKQLEDAGHIVSEVLRNDRKEVEGRKIFLNTLPEKITIPSPENHEENNTSISNTREKEKTKKEKVEDVVASIESSELRKAITHFVEMRREIKKPLTAHALKLLLAKLRKMSVNVNQQVAIVEQSVMNNWQGFYELKDNKQSKSPYNGKSSDFSAAFKAAEEYKRKVLEGRS